MSKFDKLAADLKASKTAIEAAQAQAEACRSEYIALERATKKCDSHEAVIQQQKIEIGNQAKTIDKLLKESEVLQKKLADVGRLLGNG